MSTDQAVSYSAATPPVWAGPEKELRSGDRMTREEFHRLYEQTPEGFKAELVGGTVYVASPVSRPHGRPHAKLAMLLSYYEGFTEGTECSDNTTVQLGDGGEPQPDLYLLILPEYGGQGRDAEGGKFIAGAPELIAEVAYSSRSIDLHAKREDYARYGAREYVVVVVKEQRILWFDLPDDREIVPDDNGILRSQVFPGLWINGPALLARQQRLMFDTLEAGLASDEHAAFVKQLAERKADG